MSSSRAIASAQQRRVSMKKPIVPPNNNNPRKSIASRGTFNNIQQRQQLQQLQQQQLQQQQLQEQQRQLASRPRQGQIQLPLQQQSTVVAQRHKLSLPQAISLLSDRVSAIENEIYCDEESDTDDYIENKGNIANKVEKVGDDNKKYVLNALVSRIEKLEPLLEQYEELKFKIKTINDNLVVLNKLKVLSDECNKDSHEIMDAPSETSETDETDETDETNPLLDCNDQQSVTYNEIVSDVQYSTNDYSTINLDNE